MTRTCQVTGETVLVPGRNVWSKVSRITGTTGKSAEDETVAAGSVVALKRGNARGAKGPDIASRSILPGHCEKPIRPRPSPRVIAVMRSGWLSVVLAIGMDSIV